MATLWAKNEAEAARMRAARPDADVQIRAPKQKSGETREQRVARQARAAQEKAQAEAQEAAARAAKAPKPLVVNAKPSALHRLSAMRVPGGRFTVGAGIVAAGAAAGAGAARVRKADKDTAKRVAAGAGLTYGAYLGAGYGLSEGVRRAGRNDEVTTRLMRQHRDAMGLPKSKMAHKLPPKQIDEFYRTVPAGVKFSGTRRLLARTHGASVRGRLAVPVLLAGAAGGAMYDREVRKGTNIREYPNLPEWIKENEIPSTRRNPINPLMMYSSGLMMTDAKLGRGRKLKGRARRRIGNEELQYTGGRAMLYSPLGIGALR